MSTIDAKFIPSASLKRAIDCLEDRWRLRMQISKAAESDHERAIATESAAIDKAAAGDLRTLLDMSNNQEEARA